MSIKRLNSLRRLLDIQDKQLEIARLRLAEIQSEFDAYDRLQQERTMKAELEKAKLDQNSDGNYTIGHFLKNNEREINKLENSKQDLMPLLEQRQEELREAFTMYKSTEVMFEKLNKAEKMAQARKDQITLDELSHRKI